MAASTPVGRTSPSSFRPGSASSRETSSRSTRVSPASFRKAATRNSTAVAGVVSTNPGLVMNASDAANAEESGSQLALVGRVRVKATAENGAIHPGDLLVSSGTAGYAMRAGKSRRPEPFSARLWNPRPGHGRDRHARLVALAAGVELGKRSAGGPARGAARSTARAGSPGRAADPCCRRRSRSSGKCWRPSPGRLRAA